MIECFSYGQLKVNANGSDISHDERVTPSRSPSSFRLHLFFNVFLECKRDPWLGYLLVDVVSLVLQQFEISSIQCL